MSILFCRNLSVYYGNNKAVDNVSLNIEAGTYLCIVGANGSGKSTLVKALLGLLSPKEGSVYRSKTAVGYLGQQRTLQRDFPASVREIVLSGCLQSPFGKAFYSRRDKKRADEQMEHLNILQLASRAFRDLSGGQQQRVLLARTLCAGSRLLVLDEPVTGLDPTISEDLYVLIRSLNQKEKIAVLMVSHDVERAVLNAQDILHMDTKPLFYGTSVEYQKTELFMRMKTIEVCR